MGEQARDRITEWLEIDLGKLSTDERKTLITEIFDTLSSGDLRELRDIAEQKRLEKLEETKNAVLERMREELQEAGINPEEIQVLFGRRRRSRAPLPIKYRSPEGQGWSGRGFAPTWLTKLEAEGHSRDEYLAPAHMTVDTYGKKFFPTPPRGLSLLHASLKRVLTPGA